MAVQRPLILANGSIKQLPIGDTIAGASGGSGSSTQVAKCSFVGTLTAGMVSPRWYPDRDITITAWYFCLGTPGTNITFEVLKNGVEISSTKATCSSGQYRSSDAAIINNSVTLTTSDYLTVTCVNATGGAANATICLTYS